MNKLLESTKSAQMAKAQPALRKPIEKTVQAGQQIMFSEKTRKMVIEALSVGTDPEAIGSALAKLAAILLNQSNGKIPMQVLIPSMTVLLCDALSFMEESGAVKVTPDFLAECMQAMSSAILQVMGVSPEKLQEMFAKKQGGQPAAPGGPPAAPGPGVIGSAMGGV